MPGQKKSAGAGGKAARVEEEREVESDDDITKKSSAAAGYDINHRGRANNSPVTKYKRRINLNFTFYFQFISLKYYDKTIIYLFRSLA